MKIPRKVKKELKKEMLIYGITPSKVYYEAFLRARKLYRSSIFK